MRKHCSRSNASWYANAYDTFGDYLNDLLIEIKAEVAPVSHEIEEQRQRWIIGNQHYLFLDLMIQKDYPELHNEVRSMYQFVNSKANDNHNTLKFDIDDGNNRKFKNDIDSIIERVKDVLLSTDFGV